LKGSCESFQVCDSNDVVETKKAVSQETNNVVASNTVTAVAQQATSLNPLPETKVEQLIETVEHQPEETSDTIRLLLLGPAESGKTTVLEQISTECSTNGRFRKLYNQNFTEVEMMHRRGFIFENIINSMKSMIVYLQKINMEFADPENVKNAQLVMNELEGVFTQLNPLQYDAVISLWHDASVQEIYERRSEYNLNDSTKYFLDSLERINALDYMPTPQDLVMVYCPTIGLQNVIFTVHNRTYQ
uniref:Guanine nucleotide-binding protein alpha-13 subunit (inferred by orthology to a C. elegans protein) n=1 Tax=Anisakis simplex TaxID=6269 RepID=A0A0M3K5U1_ANISI